MVNEIHETMLALLESVIHGTFRLSPQVIFPGFPHGIPDQAVQIAG